MEIPLFPLGELVLLPGMALPLYVFEPRYRELLGRIRHSREPFGIPCVLPADNEPEARIARVATLAHLVEVEYNPDGSANILVVGGERFKILTSITKVILILALVPNSTRSSQAIHNGSRRLLRMFSKSF